MVKSTKDSLAGVFQAVVRKMEEQLAAGEYPPTNAGSVLKNVHSVLAIEEAKVGATERPKVVVEFVIPDALGDDE